MVLQLTGITLTDLEIEPLFERKNSIAFTPTVEVTSDQTELGSLTEWVYDHGDESVSTWKLTAAPASGYQLAYIREDASGTQVPSEDGTTVTWDVTADGNWTAYFEPAALHFDENSIAFAPVLANSGTSGSISAKPVYAGQRAGVYFSAFVPSDIPAGTEFRYALYAGDTAAGTPLATFARTPGSVVRPANRENILLTVNEMPGDLTQVTLTAQLGDGAVTAKTVSVTVNPSGTTALTYLDVPGSGLNYETAGDPGPAVYDAAAYTDPVTGAVTLYLATNNGVAVSAGGAFSILPGLEGEIAALGTDEAGNLTAVQTELTYGTTTKDRYKVYRYAEGAWSCPDTEGHSMDKSASLRVGLVMGADDIWLQDAHWNGSAWEAHSYGFNTFWKADGSTAYAGSADGLYIYENGTWTKLDGISETRYITGGCLTAAGAKLTAANFYAPRYRIQNSNAVDRVWLVSVSGHTASADAVDLSSMADPTASGSKYVGVGADGTLYGISKGRLYENQSSSAFYGSSLFKYANGAWQHQIVEAFDDPALEDDDPSTKYRPDCVRYIVNPCDKLTLFLGDDGAIYAQYGTSTVTFETGEGSAVDPLTREIMSPVPTLTDPEREGYHFAGWYHDREYTREWAANYMPGRDITLYAKWVEKGNEDEQLAWYKEKAEADLTRQFEKYSSNDYTEEDWQTLEDAYHAGVEQIKAAQMGPENNIPKYVNEALNEAIAAMQTVPTSATGTVTVAVSVDANTLGLGFLLEPTLVEVPKGTPASEATAELLTRRGREKYGITEPGLIEKSPELEEAETRYPWASSGAVRGDFYLSDVYLPEQTGYVIPDVIQAYIRDKGIELMDEDKDGLYLSEFDYTNAAGWMYSVGDKKTGGAEFSGTGAGGWMLTEGEVVRWQFTLVGYGADLGADNTAWGEEPILTVGDKSALTWKVAELRKEHEDGVLKEKEEYNAALAVLTDAEATQEAVDAALAALEGVTFSEPPVIVTQPADRTVAEGKTAAFTVEATGDDLTYQWQYSKDGGESWKNKSGATKAEYSVKARASYDGILYRCLVTGGTETVESRSAKLTVYPLKPVIVTQPADQTAAEGQTAAFAVDAQGEDLTYQWQYSKDGGTNWHNKSGATAAVHTVKAKASYEGMLYRCKVTGAAGSVYTGSAKLTVYPLKPVIVTQPQNQTADAGKTATFTAEAQGEDLTYQWQYSNDDGKNWHNKSGAAGTSYSVKAKASYDGMLYRCKVTSAAGSVYTDSAKLTVVSKPKPVITAQPKDRSVMAGETAVFTVVAEGEGLTFQWQYSNDGETWKNKSGATSASYSVKAKTSYDGILYRCLVTNDGGTVNSGSAKLTVTAAVKPVIETQPKAQTAAAGEKATFTVEASGTGLTYQWQYSSDYGKTWHDKAGSTAATHTVTVKASFNGYLYRCKVTNAAGTTVSSKVRLTVTGVKPKVLSQPADASAAAGEKATFKVVAAGEGLTYQWQYSTDGGVTWKDKAGSTKASHTVTVKANYNGYLYRCVVINSIGSVTTDTAVLTVG